MEGNIIIDYINNNSRNGGVKSITILISNNQTVDLNVT